MLEERQMHLYHIEKLELNWSVLLRGMNVSDIQLIEYYIEIDNSHMRSRVKFVL